MSDVQDILGMAPQAAKLSAAEEAAKILHFENPIPKQVKKLKKPKGMSREVFGLLSKEAKSAVVSLAPSMQSSTVLSLSHSAGAVHVDKGGAAPGFQKRRSGAGRARWLWQPFKSSARIDGVEFYHWARADMNSLSDYPYAKFNSKLDPLVYTDDEYDHLLTCTSWSRSETDNLMYLCYAFDLRWPIVVDRYVSPLPRASEELQARFYFVLSTVTKHRQGLLNDSGGGANMEIANSNDNTHNSSFFSLENERKRRMNLESSFRNTDSVKSSSGIIKFKAAGATSSSSSSGPGRKGIGAAATTDRRFKVKQEVGAASALIGSATSSLLPVTPSKGQPCLQSMRLASNTSIDAALIHTIPPALLQQCANNANLSKNLIRKMNVLLKEWGVNAHPVPTKTVCDMLDSVKKDAITLIALQKNIEEKDELYRSLVEKVCGQPFSAPTNGFSVPFASQLLPVPTESRGVFHDNGYDNDVGTAGDETKRVVKRRKDAGGDTAPEMKKKKIA